MSDAYWITGPKVVTPDGVLDACVFIENGEISAIANEPNNDAKCISFDNDHYLIPGFIDTHIHGAVGFDVMDADPQGLKNITQALAQRGTTAFLATTMTQTNEAIEKALANVAFVANNQTPSDGAQILGLHLEGPFISKDRMGAQNPAFIQSPDLTIFKKWQSIACNMIRLVTIAPEEQDAAAMIESLVEMGVVVSVGHSNADFKTAIASFDKGIRHATHLYNAMSGFSHRNPGVAAAVLADDRVLAELICDGIHVDPRILALTIKLKGVERLSLVTDAMRAACAPEGEYDLGGQKVLVKEGAARLQSGALAGSVLTMDQAFLNIQRFGKVSLNDAVQMGCVNPAKQLRVYDRKGSVEVGKDADLVVLDANLNLKQTICRGQTI